MFGVKDLKELPKGLKVKELYLVDSSIESLPEDLEADIIFLNDYLIRIYKKRIIRFPYLKRQFIDVIKHQ